MATRLQQHPIPSHGAPLPPSLVLEVGVSESYTKLMQDAQWWHSNAPIRQAVVGVIAATQAPSFKVDIEIKTEFAVQNRYNPTTPLVMAALFPTPTVVFQKYLTSTTLESAFKPDQLVYFSPPHHGFYIGSYAHDRCSTCPCHTRNSKCDLFW